MKDEDLEKFGIIYIGDKIYPYKYDVPHIGEMNIKPNESSKDIINKIWLHGYKNGITAGENSKISEIKNILNIEIN